MKENNKIKTAMDNPTFSHVSLEVPNKGSLIIRYKYQFIEGGIILHVNGNDLATLLVLTGKENLQTIRLEMEVEVEKPNGTTENIQIELPREVMLASPEQLRQMQDSSHC